MSDTSSYVGDKLLNWIKGTTMGTAPASVFASLHSGDPAGTAANEITGTVSLTRQPITFTTPAARSMSSSGDLAFGTAASAPANVTFVAVYDVVTAGTGNEICKHNITSTAIASGNVVKILSGNLTLSY